MIKHSFIASRINVKIAYGFVAVAALLLLIGGVSYWSLSKINRSFSELEQSVSHKIISLGELRASYSSMLLEMTTFLLIDFRGSAADEQVKIIENLKNNFNAIQRETAPYFLTDEETADFRNLSAAGQKSISLLDKIVELRKKQKPLEEILIFKKQLKMIEAEEFFPLVSKLIEYNKSRVMFEKLQAEKTANDFLMIIMILVGLSFTVAIIIGLILSHREKLSDQFREQLISITSHQLKSPIAIAKGYLELLESDGPLNADQKKALATLKETTEDFSKTVGDLLDLSRIEQGKFKLEPKIISLLRLLEHVVEEEGILAKTNNLKINFKRPPEDCQIFVDESKFGQAMRNIVNNAVKYSVSGGAIEIESERSGKMVEIRVKDQGMGIPFADQKKIFGRFFRGSNTGGKKAGNGLGLFITKLIIEESGGFLSFKSEESKGTTFYITVPAA
ncbi:MAG: MCP four helix bundle domain-containing protein [Candidatus Brennerbacteria bacterium]|nr:MCP four helix bundle domain-containing protein [Candidatus Brennerbacteria bacterium]